MVVRWIVHLKDGRTRTNEDGGEIWDYPDDQITSVERVQDGRVLSIKKSELLHTFFQKTTAAVDYIPFEGGGKRAVQIEEAILGCFIDSKDGPVRIELVYDARTGHVKLVAQKVNQITKDGF